MIALPTIIARDGATADPDVQLMLRVRQGDREAFEQLVARYYDRVLFVVDHLLGNRQQAEDLAQEVFLRVYRARRSYRPESKFSTWLFVIANNVVRNARRTMARRREIQTSPADTQRGLFAERTGENEESDRETAPPDAAIRTELRETVRGAIGDLNSRQRTAVLLYHFKGMSYAEVADAMETSLCAAKALLHRARLSLRGQLQTYVNSN